jgi:hypothetical protein
VAVVEVLGVLVDSVRSEHVLQEEETVVVLVLDTWSVVEDSNVRVVHLVISDEEDGWDIDGLLGVLGWSNSVLWERSKVLLNGVNDGVVGHITGGDDDHVVTVVVGSVVVSEVIHSQGAGEISITLDWLSKHVLSERIEVSVFKSGLLEPIVVVLMLHADLILDELKLSRVKGIVSKHISKESNSFASVSLEDLKAIAGLLSIGLSSVSSSHILDFLSNLSLGSGVGSSQCHLLEEITGTSGGKILLSGSSSNVDTNVSGGTWNSLGANSDTILKGGGVERSDMLEWLWDFSEWKLSEVGHDWLLRELHELLLSLKA